MTEIINKLKNLNLKYVMKKNFNEIFTLNYNDKILKFDESAAIILSAQSNFSRDKLINLLKNFAEKSDELLYIVIQYSLTKKYDNQIIVAIIKPELKHLFKKIDSIVLNNYAKCIITNFEPYYNLRIVNSKIIVTHNELIKLNYDLIEIKISEIYTATYSISINNYFQSNNLNSHKFHLIDLIKNIHDNFIINFKNNLIILNFKTQNLILHLKKINYTDLNELLVDIFNNIINCANFYNLFQYNINPEFTQYILNYLSPLTIELFKKFININKISNL